ncbi:hypothetical protein FHU41_002049 [Psychromicrobium silvestre]|uniref:Uncharacterized protein n=1 Tax=Psychromicrobium silvestre TaxID=1645614 RepID=A0A7Y9LUD9_9MICC|nr:hypothetical protein [Psychromicrobium silvestre]
MTAEPSASSSPSASSTPTSTQTPSATPSPTATPTAIPVTPVVPTISCKVGTVDFSIVVNNPTMTGVVYTQTSTGSETTEVVTVTAAAAPGYIIAPGATTAWTFPATLCYDPGTGGGGA